MLTHSKDKLTELLTESYKDNIESLFKEVKCNNGISEDTFNKFIASYIKMYVFDSTLLDVFRTSSCNKITYKELIRFSEKFLNFITINNRGNEGFHNIDYRTPPPDL